MTSGAFDPDLSFSRLPTHLRPKATSVFRRLEEVSVQSGSPRVTLQATTVGGRSELFDYQDDLRNKLLNLVRLGVDDGRCLVGLPTGGGKTRTAVVAVRDLIEQGTVQVVFWIAPAIELLQQAQHAFREAWSRRDVGPLTVCPVDSFMSEHEQSGPVVILATAQWLGGASQRGLPDQLPAPHLIVFDEAHQAIAPTYLEGVDALRTHKSADAVPVVGLSATPGRSDVQEVRLLADFFGRTLLVSERLGKNPVDALQSRGVLAEIDFTTLPLSGHQATSPPTRDRFPSLDAVVNDPVRMEQLVDTLKRSPSGSRTLVFAASVDHATGIAAALTACGKRALPISTYTSPANRDKFLHWFRAGQVPVLVNKDLLVTGFDLPALDQVFLAAPVRSSIRFEQIVGRVIRGPAVGGQPQSRVFQFEAHDEIHGTLESYSRFWDYGWRPQ